MFQLNEIKNFITLNVYEHLSTTEEGMSDTVYELYYREDAEAEVRIRSGYTTDTITDKEIPHIRKAFAWIVQHAALPVFSPVDPEVLKMVTDNYRRALKILGEIARAPEEEEKLDTLLGLVPKKVTTY